MSTVTLSKSEAEKRHIPQKDYRACDLAFIDCRTPGSFPKKNYSIIGPGVTTSADQVVNCTEPHGFNIGAAATGRGITNNLHLHYTAEVFMVYEGSWTFRWGNEGKDGEVTLGEGDILSVPTWIFRGFTNMGSDGGMIFTTLGGDDTGGVVWHPDVIETASRYGLYLTRESRLVDREKGEPVPAKEDRISAMTRDEINALRSYTPTEMADFVVQAKDRIWHENALLDSLLPGCGGKLSPVIGYGISEQRNTVPPITKPHGFTMEWLRLEPGKKISPFKVEEKQVLIPRSGKTLLTLNQLKDAVSIKLGEWDCYSVPGNVYRSLKAIGETPSEVLVITAGDGRKRIEWAKEVVLEAKEKNVGVDPDGYLAPYHLLPQRSMRN